MDNRGVAIGARFPDVLEAARKGAEWAFEALYRDLAPPVLGYLRGQAAAEPEDLASEVFVGVVRNLRTFEGDERAFRAWVFSIAHRRLMDERRRLSRRREEPTDPQQIATALSEALAGHVEEEALSGSVIAEALAHLSPDQRAVFLLRTLVDLSVAEVASLLGKRKGAVKALQRRAIRALARHIEREGVS